MAKKLGCASCGGTKKMAKGGQASSRAINTKGAGYAPAQTGSGKLPSVGIYGMPSTNTANAGIATMKKGGTVSSRAVQTSCKQGYVRSASGKCVKERSRFGD
jgi:hypothetical protein